MKKNGIISIIGILILLLAFLTGCSAAATAEQKLDQIEENIDHHLDAAEDAAEAMVLNILTTDPPVPLTTDPPPVQEPAQLTAEEAKAIALSHAGFSADQVTWLRSEYEIDDGIPEFEVEFHSGDTEYDYTIHAESGEIRRWDKDYEPERTAPAPTQPPATEPPATEAPSAQLTADEAKAIALAHAGFAADQVTRLRTEFDWDDGVPTWDVEFHEGYWEYDYEIHAESGKILSFDKDD